MIRPKLSERKITFDAAKEGTLKRQRAPQQPDQAQPVVPEQDAPRASWQDGTLKRRRCPAPCANSALETARKRITRLEVGLGPCDPTPQAGGSTATNTQQLHSDRCEIIDLTAESPTATPAPQPPETSMVVRAMQCLPKGASADCTDARLRAGALTSAAAPQLVFDPLSLGRNHRRSSRTEPQPAHQKGECLPKWEHLVTMWTRFV